MSPPMEEKKKKEKTEASFFCASDLGVAEKKL